MAKCLAFATLAVLVLAQFATAGPLVPAGAMGKLRRHANTHHSSIQSRIFAAQQAGPNETTTHAPGNPLCQNTSIFTEVDQACGNWGEASVALISLSANASVDAELNKFCSATCQTKFNEMAAWFDTCSGPGLSEAFAVLSSGCISHEGQLCAIKLRVLTRMECEDKTTQATCTEGNNLCRWNAKKSRCDMWTNNQALGDLCTPCFDQYLLLMSQLATASYEQAPAHSASQRQAANATTPAPTKKPVDQKKVAESQNQQDEFLAYQDLLCSREDDIGFCLPILQGIDEDLYNFDHEAANQSTIAEIVNATNNVCMEATERCLNRQRLSLRRLYQHDADNLFYSCAETQYLEAAYELWTFNFSDWQRVHANSTYNGTHVFWRVSPNPYAETPEQGVHYNGTHVIIDVRLAFGPAKPHRRQTVEQIEAKVNLSTCIGHWEEVMMGAAKEEAVADFTCTRNEKNQSCIVILHEMLKNPCFESCAGNCSAWFQDFVMNQGCCIAQLHAVYTVADFDHDAAPILEGNLSKANVTLKPDLTPTWENHMLHNWVETCHHDVTTFNYTAVKAQLLKQCPQPTVEPERTFPLQGLRWDELLANPKLKKAIEAALKADIARSLGIPAADLENATFVVDESQTLSSVKTTNRQGNATTKGAKFQFKTSGKDNAGAAKNAANFDKAASSGKLSVSGTAGVITKKCKTCIGGAPGAPAPTGNLFAALLGKSVSGATTRAPNGTTTTRPGATTRAPGSGLASPAPAVSGFVAAVIAAVVAMLM